MNKRVFMMLCLVSLAVPACVVTTTNRDVGSVASDGTVYLGWNLIGRDGGNNKPNDQDTYDIGAHLGSFSAIRLHVEKPIAFAEVLVIFANGERWVAQVPPVLNNEEWSPAIPLPGGPRQIHSIVVTGRSTTSLLSRLEIHGFR
jgi:hypothetical protein